jgi:2-oxoglutarate ferredoxin oxidoreductase subunit delta
MEGDKQKVEASRPRKSGSASKSKKAKAAGGAAGVRSGKKKRYEIDVFRDWCKSCGICAAFCPRGCIQLDDEGAPPARIDSEQCTGCGWCELHCPDLAISVHEKNSSATEDTSANRVQNR